MLYKTKKRIHFLVSASFLYEIKSIPKIAARNRSFYLDALFRYGMDECDSSCMKANAAIRIGAGRTVFQIPLDGTSHLGQLASYLMVATGLQVHFQ
jgi:hypothetical protein